MDTGPKQSRQMNPRYKANIFSILTFGWTLETFKLGYNRDLNDNDLYAPLPEHRSDVLGDAMQRAWEHELEESQAVNKDPSLWRVLFKVFGSELLLYGLVLAAMEFIIRLQQPLFLGLLLRYYSPMQDSPNSTRTTYLSRYVSYYESPGAVSRGEAALFAGGVALASAASVAVQHPFMMAAMHVGMKMRVGVCSLIYRKGAVSRGEAALFAGGVALASAASVAVQHPFMMAAMHVGMKMRVGVCSLIYRKVLNVSLQAMSESGAGLVVNLMANDVNRFDTGPLFAHYLWIGPLETVIMTIYLYREMGLAAVYGSIIIIAVIPFQIFLGNRTAYYRKQTALKSDERVRQMKEIIMGIEVIKMYTWEEPFQRIIDAVRRQEIRNIKMTSYIRGVILSFIMFTSRFGIFATLLMYVSYASRVSVENVFFLTCYYNIVKQTMTLYFPQAVGQIAEMNVAVRRIRDYLLSEECQFPLRTMDGASSLASRSKKRVTIMVDPIPQTHLANAEAGTSNTNQNKSKDLRHGEVKISFEKASSRWIKSLERDDVEGIDLKIMSGALTMIVGSVGAGKSTVLHMVLGELPCSSGSMRADGTLSYASQEPWLFVGTVRQNILFGQPFVKSRYMEVCRVCALERDISLFPHGDKTVIGERGVSLSGGQRARINLARAVYKHADIYLLDDPLSAVDTQVAKHIFERCIKRYLADKTVILVTHQLQFIKSADHIVIMEKGKILSEGDFNELDEQDLGITQLLAQKASEVRSEENSSESVGAAQPSTMSFFKRHWSMMLEASIADQKPETEMQAVGRVQGSVYREYFLAGASWPFALLVLVMFLLAQGCASACDYWLSRWSDAEDHLTGDATVDNTLWAESGISRNHFVVILGIITITTVTVAILRAFMFFSLCMASSIRFHDKMFECIAHSPMMFFHANPSGRILNRFSKDMGAIDELLPQAMIDCFQIMLNLIGVIVVILITDITLLIPIVTTIIIFYIFRVIYIRTASAVKRLEGITRSPVFGHLTATVQGAATVRAFGAEALLAGEFDRHQDLHSAAWYLFITCSRAFGYFLDVVCLLFIVCVTFGCLMKTDMDASGVGLAITQSISLTGVFQWGMRQSAETENQMTSVERVLEYTQLPREHKITEIQEKQCPPDWPSAGHIQFENLSLKYTPDGDYVLHKLQLEVQPQQKIGIVGRTGAGKSSIIQALFRLAFLEGRILIDGLDISTEPVLFSGTLRKNLDPFDEFSDDVLLSTLKNVELLSEDAGYDELYKTVSEGGVNFSVGSRQLVCVARAAARAARVLLLDEATANVDARTDALVQAAVRAHFAARTVLTVAHRLHTVIDSDKILVLDAGRLMEFDHPHILLQNQKGYFHKMVAETGSGMAAALHKMAEESYLKTQKQ